MSVTSVPSSVSIDNAVRLRSGVMSLTEVPVRKAGGKYEKSCRRRGKERTPTRICFAGKLVGLGSKEAPPQLHLVTTMLAPEAHRSLSQPHSHFSRWRTTIALSDVAPSHPYHRSFARTMFVLVRERSIS